MNEAVVPTVDTIQVESLPTRAILLFEQPTPWSVR